jgi:hypothetical protein
VTLRWLSSRRARAGLLAAFALALVALVGWSRVRPSHAREWVPEQAVLPTAEFDGGQVRIRGVRNFDWRGEGPPVARFEERTYRLDRIETVWYVLSPFDTDWRGPAHSFLSFGFSDSQYVAISVEARKEVGESYSILGGLLKRYELMYVVGDERDLLGLRVFRNDDEIQVYPVRASREAVRELFVEMLERANGLAERPEFYGSLFNNCTTNILRHVNRVAPRPIRYGLRVLFPGQSDVLADELGLLDTGLPIRAARVYYRVNERVRQYADSSAFPTVIRPQ